MIKLIGGLDTIAGGFRITSSYSPTVILDLMIVNGGKRSSHFFGPKG